MRIALVNRRFSESYGGVERFSLNLARQLVAAGHQVHVFANRWDVEPDGVTLHRVPMLRLFSWTKMMSFARNVPREIAKEAFDVVYTLTAAPGGDIFRSGGLHRQWLAAKHPNPAVRWVRSITSTVNLSKLFLEKKIFSEAGYGCFVANSKMGKEHIILHYGTPANRIRVVYNGVDREVFNASAREKYRSATRQAHGIPEDVPVFLFLAANWKRKGLEFLLRALPPGEDYRALVVGKERSGPFERIAAERGVRDHVVFAGPTPEPVRYYGAADLFVLPTRYDPFANVCLEALACGLPVITSRENGAAELIEPGVNGYLLDRPDDVAQIREFLLRYLRTPEKAAMRDAAAGTGARYSAERTARETLRVFEDARAGKMKRDGLSENDEAVLAELMGGRVPKGWEEVRHSRAARVFRGTLADGRRVYYKEFLPRNIFEGVKSSLRGSRGRRAQRGSAALRSKGLEAPQTIRAGSLSGGRSYLLSEAAPGPSLEDYFLEHFSGADSPVDIGAKRRFVRELGRAVARLHRRGIIHGDLRGHNILVEETGEGWKFHFIDNEGTYLSVSETARERNLVQAGMIALPGLTLRDRMRFFTAYRDARPGTVRSWKRTATAMQEIASRRLKERGISL